MLTIKCAACKRKLWKYDKIGQGQVLRCHKDRILRVYQEQLVITESEITGAERTEEAEICCQCGKRIGIDEGTYIKMIGQAFTYTGTKRNR